MHKAVTIFLPLILAVLPNRIIAADSGWGIGFAVGVRPSFSVQHRFARSEAAHYTLHYTDDALSAGFDYQKFINPGLGLLPHSVEVYSGFGLTGEARKAQETTEQFHGKIPAGLQWSDKSLRMSAFVELAARMGPVPKTSVTGEAGCGIRTVF